jgi:hypothetical protein
LFVGTGLREIFRRFKIGDRKDWQHAQREFYGEKPPLAFWPERRGKYYTGDKEEILRQGFLESIRVAEGLGARQMRIDNFAKKRTARRVKRRIEMWWVCSGYSGFEVNVLNGEAQVTMLILTPAMPPLPDVRKAKLERPGIIWTVASRETLQSYVDYYRKDQKRYPKISPAYSAGDDEEEAELGRLEKLSEDPPRRRKGR